MEDDIVITGISGRYPECDNVEEFWYNLMNAVPMYTSDNRRWPVELLDLPKFTGKLKEAEKFDSSFFNISDQDAHLMDPQMRIFHETTYEAIYDAGCNPHTFRNTSTSVYLGSCYNDTCSARNEDLSSNFYLDLGPSEISKTFGFWGTSLLIDTACASSFSALHEAVQSIRMNLCDQAIVGGIALHLRPNLASGFRNLRMLSSDGKCKCLDAKADGYCRSEAIVSMFIQRRKDANRIYATILHSKTNDDGYKTEGITFPSRDAQFKLMQKVYSEAKIDPEENINYVEAHITGTPVGDPIECSAILAALRPNRKKSLKFGCLKSNIGHSEGSSALCSITKVALALQRHEIPPNINYETPNPNIEELRNGLILPVTKPEKFDETIVAVNSFGFGGVNVHAILKANEKTVQADDFIIQGQNGINRLINLSNRTVEGLNYTLDYIKNNRSKINRDYLAILDKVSKIDLSTGLNCRGYAILNEEGQIIEKNYLKNETKRPIYFVFNGLGSQWPGMAKRLLVFDEFKKSIEKSASILKPFGLDLLYILTEADDSKFEKDLCTTLVGITSVQIALVDLLNYLEIYSDGIIGHSVGEYGAAYAAKSATQEEIIQLVYWLGKINNELHTKKGQMASIGLDWKETVEICKKYGEDRVFASCDNSDNNVTISGDHDLVQQIVKDLGEKNVFAKKVFSCEMAFHCASALVAYNKIKEKFETILTSPKKHSEKWLSTSLTEDQFEKEDYNHFSAEYCANNMVAPVYFRKALKSIPNDAIIIEIGPHSQLLPLIRSQLGINALCVALTQRNLKNNIDNANILLNGLGQIYLSGHNPNISKLYPKVNFPVSRETLSTSHLIKWDHSKSYFLAKFPENFNFLTSTIKFKIDLLDPNIKYISGHCIDGRILFPATGYLHLIWQHLIRINKKININEVPVEFFDVNLMRAIIIPKNGSVTLQITLMENTGEFSIIESGSTCCIGKIRMIQDSELNLNKQYVKRVSEEDVILLKNKDIYKELRIRGYDYSGLFQGLHEALSDGSYGKVKWSGNWVSFTDCMLQMAVLGQKGPRRLFLPTFIEYVRIDSSYVLSCAEQMKKEFNEILFEVNYDKFANIGCTKGVLIKGLKASPVPRRQNVQTANIDYYEFTPYDSPIVESKLNVNLNKYLNQCDDLIESNFTDSEVLNGLVEEKETNSLALLLRDLQLAKLNKQELNLIQVLDERKKSLIEDKLIKFNFDKVLKKQFAIVAENFFTRQIKLVEVNCTSKSFSTEIEELIQNYNLSSSYYLMQETAACNLQLPFVEKLIEFNVNLNTLPDSLNKVQLMIFFDWNLNFLCNLHEDEFDYKVFLESSFHSMVNGSFFVFFFRNKYTKYEQILAHKLDKYQALEKKFFSKDHIEELLKSVGFIRISTIFDEETNIYSVLVRKPSEQLNDEDHYVIPIKIFDYSWVETLKKAIKDKRKRIWLVSGNDPINGLIGMANCLKREPGGDHIRCIFNSPFNSVEINTHIKQKDLFFNIYKSDNKLGSYRHYALDLNKTKKTKDAYVDIVTRGDLSSLRWLELNTKKVLDDNTSLIEVHYSALNFKDIMVASGRVPLSAYPSSKDFCGIGMEYSGINVKTGKKVFGFTNCASISTKLYISNDSFYCEVPDKWSLTEASTISVVYVTIYYSLFLRGNLLPGESILIHAGSGGIGQAAISVCLSKGCEVFTTVGTDEKKKFLLERFSKLKSENIFNSRTSKFEEQILKATNGQGVDMILNSLAEEKLRASVNCLSEFGRFIEIGKYDMIVNNKLDLSQFTNNKTFSVVCVAHLQDDALNKKNESAIRMINQIQRMLIAGIENGEVQPLPYTIFKSNEVETAFRYMANGKHIGKVLIEIRNENQVEQTFDALPQCFFYEKKSYIITGGLGGFGLELADWLVSKGAKNLILSSRSGVCTQYQKLALKRLHDNNIKVLISNDHATTYNSAASLLEQACELGPVGGIFNLAVVLKDSIIENQTKETFESVCLPKVNTTIYLDKLSRKLCPELDYFVCFSSAASGIGNPGQTNYGFANSVMERVCEKRREEGLHGLAVQWGAIGDVGIVAEQFGNDVNLGGTVPQRIPFCLEVLDKFISSDHAVCSSIVLSAAKKSLGKDRSDLVRTICHVIGIKDINNLEPNTTLVDLGLDSLMAVEIKQGLEREYDTVLSTQEIRQLTLRDLQEIGTRKQTIQVSNKKGTSELSSVTINTMLSSLPTNLFVRLNKIEEKQPIFFVPPIEGDFKLLHLLAEYIGRPIIGLNWTEEVNKFDSIKEVANYYSDKLIEEFNQNDYDFVAYSFGTVLTYELVMQLKEKVNQNCVKNLVFLDGSPEQLKLQTEHLIQTTETHDEESAFAELLLTFLSIFHEIEHIEIVRQQLRELKSKLEKTQMIAEYLSLKLHVKVDANQLQNALDIYMSKLKMIYLYNPEKKYNGNIKLIKAREKHTLFVETINKADFGLSKLLTEEGSIEVIQLEGDHRTFISLNAQDIGTYIDNVMDYIPI